MERGKTVVSFRALGTHKEDYAMPILLWLLGIPIPIIILLVLLAR
jgi:hypothetical protein